MSKMIRPLIVAFFALALAACSKEKSVDTSEDGGPGVLRMKVDGVQWNATVGVSAFVSNGVIIITGASADEKTLYLELDGTTVQKYDLNQTSNSYATYVNQKEPAATPYATDEGQSANDAGGEVTVTKIDATKKRISGTFTFRMFRDIDSKQVIVTEGVFDNLPYLTDAPGPGGVGSGTLTAKVDGAAYNGDVVVAVANGPVIMITATQADATAKTITLTVPSAVATGTYNFDGATYNGVYAYLPTGTTTPNGYAATGPELIITEHNTTNKTLKGTFKFTGTAVPPATGTAAITEGSFSVTYQ